MMPRTASDIGFPVLGDTDDSFLLGKEVRQTEGGIR